MRQIDLAKKITWTQTQLSRTESGDREATLEEIGFLVDAIDTPEAKQFGKVIGRQWHRLPAPPLNHPDQEILWRAELVARELATLYETANLSGPFRNRLGEYRAELERRARRILKLNHTVAFVGSIGVGKSTAICRLAALEVPESGKPPQPVLEVGGGGVTICEVHVSSGPQYGISIEPCTDERVRQHVADFADQLMSDATNKNSEAGQLPSKGNSKEIERAIRNMAKLHVRRQDKSDPKSKRIDDAEVLASSCEQHRDLVVEILARMELHKRDLRALWYEPTSGKPPLNWLKETFEKINNGRHDQFGLPERIEVVIPDKLFEQQPLSIRLVDTKGIDRTAARPDLEGLLTDSHTLTLLCSSFNSAPSTEAQRLLERAHDAGVSNIELGAALLVLPRPDEAVAMKDDSGHSVENAKDGYVLKADQVDLAVSNLGFKSLQVGFFNSREDDPEGLKDFLQQRLGAIRAHFVSDLSSTIEEVEHVLANQTEQQVNSVLSEAAKHLKNWLTNNRAPTVLKRRLHEALIKEIRLAHASTIHASVRRQGEWYNLDFGHQLGHGAKVVATTSIGEQVREFAAIAENLKTNPDLSAAIGLVDQCDRVLQHAYENLLDRMQLFGQQIFENELKKDQEYWALCEIEWGIGVPGYRDRVGDKSEVWFKIDEETLSATVAGMIEREWTQCIDRASSLLP